MSALSLHGYDCLHRYTCRDEVAVVTRPHPNQKSWLYSEFHVLRVPQRGPVIS